MPSNDRKASFGTLAAHGSLARVLSDDARCGRETLVAKGLLLARCYDKRYMIKMYKHAFGRYRLQQGLLQSLHKHLKTSKPVVAKARQRQHRRRSSSLDKRLREQKRPRGQRKATQKREAMRKEEGDGLITY